MMIMKDSKMPNDLTNKEQMIEECLKEANQFFSVCKIITDAGVNATHLYPCIASLSFAIELYFKKILLENQPVEMLKTHDFYNLFKLLPQQEQTNLIQKWRERYNSNLEEGIQKERCAYNEWRFGYEKEEIHADPAFLSNLAEFLKEYVEEKG